MGRLAVMTSGVLCVMAVHTLAQGWTSVGSTYRAIPGCEADWISPDTPISSLTVSSQSKGAISCLATNSCLAFNICLYQANWLECDLFPSTKASKCGGLQSKNGCSYMEIQEDPCQNGGTWVSPACACVDGYAGQYCERYIRSCKEGRDLGVRVNNYYMIQPFGSPVAYRLYCPLQWAGTVYIFVRKRNPSCAPINFDMTWDEYKKGWGDVSCGEYFVGLETMYQLMKYEQFQTHMYGVLNDATLIGHYYSNFTVQSEDENYRMDYQSAFKVEPGDNGLGMERPRDFCTRDRDCGTCAATNGGGWWYCSGCAGHPVTSSLANFKWPVDGIDEELDEAFWQLDHMAYLP